MKLCTKCGLEKACAEFNKRIRSRDGLHIWCRLCNKNYYRNNRIKILEQKKSYYAENMLKINKRSKIHHQENRAENLQKMKVYYHNNRQAILERVKIYSRENKAQKSENLRKWKRKRRREDPVFSMMGNVVRRMSAALSREHLRKSNRSHEYIGCTWEDLARHIERQFPAGMSWENRGAWHVDHIIPLASANTKEELIPLFHFTNLRPLWAEDNMEKSNKRLLLI